MKATGRTIYAAHETIVGRFIGIFGDAICSWGVRRRLRFDAGGVVDVAAEVDRGGDAMGT